MSVMLTTPLRVLAVCDEWLPALGGLSTLNRSLCTALTDAGCEVHCAVPGASPEEREDADAAGVTLVVSAPLPGMSDLQALMRRPHLPDGIVPDVVIGHGRITGQVAKSLADDHFPGARRIHCVHMDPNEIEWNKLGQRDDAGTRADERSRIELALASDAALAVPVGPRLDAWLRRDLRVPDGTPPLVRLDPGFDGGEPVSRRVPDGREQIMLMGRVNDARTKGVDLAARAVGHALGLNRPFAEWDLLVRGAAAGTCEDLHARLLRWIGHRAVNVTVRPYTADRDAIRRDLLRTSLLLMPGRVEGYGLVGQEAIMAGTPVLISDRSGLGALLREVLPAELAHRVVVPVDRDDKADIPVWGHRVAAVLLDREAAFGTAAAVRDIMASERTWARATRRLLDGLGPFSA
ncbi:glycosyltransferase family 4 protein [Streptomyces sp. NBC_01281]|uniref:glycosyltransferase family 4 protein n=1 Tax=Streptomyces sp. NBC_01281 TaxID=2903811 RepID=UPI002E0FDEC0|nr:glycosyltransferase family 4 protein [Streptomyces sp. NBC_01281]